MPLNYRIVKFKFHKKMKVTSDIPCMSCLYA